MICPYWGGKSMDDRELVQMAREILPNAYAPYSGYRVGAALMTDEGRVFRGVNIENASSGLTICAERAAVAAAVTAGYRLFSRIAVVSEDERPRALRCLPSGAERVLRRRIQGAGLR